MEARDSFKSRLGFILVSAGCAIGIGNVWRFPYVTGEYGGAVFVLFYLLFLVILGIPVVTMELAVGRASRKSVKEGFMKLEPPGTWWHLHGWIALAGSFVLMIYYTTISGWMVDYFIRFLNGSFQGLSTKEVADVFGVITHCGSPGGHRPAQGVCRGGCPSCSGALRAGPRPG